MFQKDSVKAIMNLDFNKICRLCLRYLDDCYDLSKENFASDLIEAINYCYCLQINLNDALPKKICSSCVQLLQNFYFTKKNVLAGDQLLRDFLYFKKLENTQLTSKTDSFNLSSLSDKSKEPENISIDDSSDNGNKKIDDFSNNEHNDSGENENETNQGTNEIMLINNNLQKDSNSINHEKENSNCAYSEETNNEDDKFKKENDNLKKVRKSKKSSDISKKEVISLLKIYQESEFFKSFNDINGLSTRSLRNVSVKESDSRKVISNEKDEHDIKLPTSSEKQLKVIGTVIDESNILSPEIKRSRKSVLSKEVLNYSINSR